MATHKKPSKSLTEKLHTRLDEAQQQVHQLRLKLGMPPPIYPTPDSQHEAMLLRMPGNCPYCGSTELSASDYDGERILTCTIECDSCKSVWVELYQLIGATDWEWGDD